MFTNFSEFIDCIVEARFGFEYLWNVIVDLYYSITQNSDIGFIWGKLMSFLTPIMAFVPYIIMALGLAVALFGKKIGGIIKFVGFFVIGFVLGVYYLGPIIPAEVPIPSWVIGLVVAIVVAVLSKFLFVAVYSVAVLYSVYRLCYHGFFLDNELSFSAGKAITSLAVAAIVLVLTLILFKFVEMLLSSAFGAWMITSGFALGIIDLGAIPNLGSYSWILELSIIGIITLLTFIFQVKTRKRY